MNAAEHLFCSSSLWRYFTGRHLLSRILSCAQLGDHLLEIGAGYGAATAHLQSRVARVTSLDYDLNSVRKLKFRNNGGSTIAVCGDASQLPFACQTFSSAVAILMLHHLKSREIQDRMFAEVLRILRPGGVFLAFDITHLWFHPLLHARSTYTPVSPSSLFSRLTAAGFSKITLDVRTGAFRATATRRTDSSSS
jgi:ubiquinone/menaquinone biosynthesis C-methylase UbiE